MIPKIPLQDYFDYVLPPLPAKLVDKFECIIQTLENNEAIRCNRWVFPVDSALDDEDEHTISHRLREFYNAVVNAAQDIDDSLEPTFGLVVNGNNPVYSDRGVSSRPNAFLKLNPKLASQSSEGLRYAPVAQRTQRVENGEDFVYDIANPQQFKLKEGMNDTDDDVAKLVYDMEQILALDPCRRFTLGATIDDCTMRLWFLSRATLLKTKPFDFTKDRRQLIHYFLSLAFASPTDMGWDSTVEFSHYSQSGRRQYKIEVDGQKFTTVDVLSDASAARPLGRATRVWKVLDSSGIIRVLKDVWLESDRMGEHEIHQAILDDVEKFDQAHHSNYRAKLEQRMLRPLAQCRVPVNHKPDDTAAVMLRGYDSSNDSSVDRFTSNNPSNPAAQSVGFSMSFDRDPDDLTTEPKPDNSQITQEPAAINQDSDQIMSTELAKRKARNHIHHHRIVFKHYATTIYNERSLGDTLCALIEVVRALGILHRVGWVHRDISGGNIDWFADEKIGLLGDFEYATHLKEPRRHNVRTGTPFFMAAETLVNDYLFTAVPQDLNTDEEEEEDDFIPFEPQIGTEAPVVPHKTSLPPSFSHNPLHDLESIWWILIYVLFFNDDACNPSQDSETRQEKMNELFHGKSEATGRFLLLIQSAYLNEAKGHLSPSFAPAIETIKALALLLTAAYQKSEKQYNMTGKIDDKCFEIHRRFCKLLTSKLLNSLCGITLVPVKDDGKKRTNLGPPETESPAKRSRTSVP
ncbi:hypothetical protein F5880DRAFT_786438 [Lentinula raphanica]|nr:hypothetical protein F5880DRAFT_786438 [Lentinula raphanica]